MLRPVALTGRVLVKVSAENGPIKIGDYLTASSLPGVAMKATAAGKTIGMALENFDSPGVGQVMMFVNVDWYGGEEGVSIVGTITGWFSSILDQFKELGIVIQQNFMRVKRLVTAALVIEKSPIPEESTIGEGIILSGTSETIIYNNNVKPTSKIFVTFRGDYRGRWWASEIDQGYFKISLSETALQDIEFDYWIVGVGEPVLEGNLGLTPEEVEPPAGGDVTSEVNVCQNGENRACGTEVGACQIGVQICENGVWGECFGGVEPVAEICDGVDNDCDGQVDEDGICGSPLPEPEATSTGAIAYPEQATEPVTTSTEPIITSTSTEPIVDTSTSTDQTTSTPQ
jgi:hypothetical protein